MAVTAKSVIIVDAPVAEAFAKFIDFPRWEKWMPELFEPVSGPNASIAEGDKLKVRLRAGGRPVPAPIKVLRIRQNQEVAWGGGVPGLVSADHAFFFEDTGDGRTRIRSEETFTGLLTVLPPVKKQILREATRIGEGQLGGFRDWIARNKEAA